MTFFVNKLFVLFYLLADYSMFGLNKGKYISGKELHFKKAARPGLAQWVVSTIRMWSPRISRNLEIKYKYREDSFIGQFAIQLLTVRSAEMFQYGQEMSSWEFIFYGLKHSNSDYRSVSTLVTCWWFRYFWFPDWTISVSSLQYFLL